MVRVVEALSTVHAANDGTVVLVPTLLPIAAQLFHFGYLDLGILVAAGYAVNVAVQPLVGRFYGKIEAGTLLSCGVGILAISMIIISFANSYGSLLVGAVVLRIGSSFYHPIGPSVVSKTYSGTKVDHIMGVQSGFGDLGSFLMFLTASLLYSALGWKLPFLIFAVVDLVVAMIALIFLRKLLRKKEDTLQISFDIREGGDSVTAEKPTATDQISPGPKRDIALPILFIGTFMAGGSYAIILNFANSLMAGVYHSVLLANLPVSLWLLSFIFADFTTGLFSRKIGRIRLLLISYFLSSISIAFFCLIYGNLLIASLSLVTNGFVLSFTYPLTYSAVGTLRSSKDTKNWNVGALFGLLFSVQVIGSALFSYLGGEISQAFNPVYPFGIVSGILLGVTVLIVLQLRRV
jgi:MFS family permease